LEYYQGLHEHLTTAAQCIWADDDCRLYRLRD
jgi:hypothetical protein